MKYSVNVALDLREDFHDFPWPFYMIRDPWRGSPSIFGASALTTRNEDNKKIFAKK